MESSKDRTLSRRRLMYAAAAGAAAVAVQPVLDAGAAGTSNSRKVTALAAPRAQDRVKIVHWAHPLTADDAPTFDSIIQQFQDAGNNIDVEVQLEPWDARVERKLAAFAAGQSPDSSYLNSDEFAQYAEQGSLVVIDKYVTEEDLADLLPGPRDAMEWDGIRYQFPILFIPTYPLYNRDIFEKSGLDPDKPPVTWDELDAQMAQIKAAKDEGKHDAWPMAIPELESVSVTFNAWFYQAGGSVLTPEGKSGYDAPAGVDAVAFAVHLADNYNSPGNAGAKFGALEDQFFSGQVAYQFLSEHRAIKRWADEFPDFKLDVAPPTGRDKQASLGGTGAVGLWASEGNTHPDEAWQWIHFLTNEGNLEYNKAFGLIPARQSLLTEFSKTALPLEQKAMEIAFPHCNIAEKHPKIRDMWAALDPNMQAAFAGDKAPDVAVQDAAAKINSEVLTA